MRSTLVSLLIEIIQSPLKLLNHFKCTIFKNTDYPDEFTGYWGNV